MARRFKPAYLNLLSSGELAQRVTTALERLKTCTICAYQCRVNRSEHPQQAVCRTGDLALVASFSPHFGEENPLRGARGSGTIFFSNCNLSCLFCQNYDISQHGHGRTVSTQELASMMLQLQAENCHNINLVSPSHVVPQIMEALLIAAQAGLHLPLVYNSGGYDSRETLALLDGVIDIYMPDMKYADPKVGRRLSGPPNYPQINQKAVKEMHRQVGDLALDERGVAQRGLLIRHLVLPGQLAGTAEIVCFLAQEVSPHTYLNVMDQYRPCYQARENKHYPEMGRPITRDEYQQAVGLAKEAGLSRLDKRHPRIL